MKDNLQIVSVEELCKVIDLLNPCMDDCLYVYDFEHDYYYISPHALERFPLPQNSFHDVVKNHALVVYPPDLEKLQEDLNSILANEKDYHNMEYRWKGMDGEPIWINCRGNVVRRGETAVYMIGCINEIGAKQKADNVSGLRGESSLQTYLKEVCPLLPQGYLLRLGLDNFKEINEKLGIEYGDMILKRTAECLSECILPGQKLYRIVADEFIILDFMGGTAETAAAQYRKIRQTIDRFVEDNLYEAVFTVSGGFLSCSDIEDFTYSNVMKLSEFALHEAKRQGKNRCYYFQAEDYTRFLKKKKLTQLLRQAVNHNFEGFEAYFQPLFHADTNTLYGAEALMRFHTEEYGMVSPAEFIPILEETGLIIPAGRWMVHQALDVCRKIQTRVPDFRISINISFIQIIKSDIINELVSAVSEHNILPSRVIVELTESGFLESDERFSKLWERLKDNGISLALDDFGTGYSNFHYLYDLRPNIIKIDRSFTAKALENEYEYNLLSLMSELVHNLDLKLCIEGIETEEERVRLQKLSPDYSQGFYFGRPCPYQKFLEQFV